MGDDAVAVHIADKWILSGKVKMHSQIDRMNAQIFADFNRSSLIGMSAPLLAVRDTSGAALTVPMGNSILYFYDTDCASCKVETLMLKGMLERRGFDGTLVAFYVGADEEAWARYRQTALNVEGVDVLHVWDPEADSDFRRMYGVLKTPSMLFVGSDGIIAGRGLDTGALEILLDRVSPAVYEYGGDDAYAMLDSVFGEGPATVDNVMEMGRFVEDNTLNEGDTLGYKHMTGDILYWLTSRAGSVYKRALGPFAREFVLGRDVWKTAEDTLQVVGLARMVDDLSNLSPIGEKVPGLKVRGTMLRRRLFGGVSRREGEFNLGNLGGRAIVVFFTHGCPHCEETLSAAERVASSTRTRVLLVDMDQMFSSGQDEATALLDAFDLSTLPYVTELDRRGRVVRKYMDFAEN